MFFDALQDLAGSADQSPQIRKGLPAGPTQPKANGMLNLDICNNLFDPQEVTDAQNAAIFSLDDQRISETMPGLLSLSVSSL